jgi:hypothetical protein
LEALPTTMLFRPFLAASVLSLSVSAFLVVPSIPKPIEEAVVAEEPEFHTLDRIGTQKSDLELICSECPFAEMSENGQVNWVEGVETLLV